MKSKLEDMRWHAVDGDAARQLTTTTSSPGVVYPVDNRLLPSQLKRMTNVSSFYVSGYTSPESLSNSMSARGEMIVARADGDLTKNYNYVFAVASDGAVYFCGPFKGFNHHMRAGAPVEVSSLFGQTPFGKNKF